jgi:hypothetical protein
MSARRIICKSKFRKSEKGSKKQNLQFQTGTYDSKVVFTKPNRLKHQQKTCKMAVDQPFPLKKAHFNRRSNLACAFRKSKFHPLGEWYGHAG